MSIARTTRSTGSVLKRDLRREAILQRRLSIVTLVGVILLVSWMQTSDMSRWSAFEYRVGSTVGYPVALPGLLAEATFSNRMLGRTAPEPLRSAIRILCAALFWAGVVYLSGGALKSTLRAWQRR